MAKNPFRAERLGGYMPFLWYGMTVPAWFALLRRGGWSVTANRLPNVAGVTTFAPLASAMGLLSETLHAAKAERTPVEAPLFVLGHWRTGTTFLHNLLALDPRMAAPTTFQCMFPDGFLVGENFASWALDLFLPRRRPMDDVPISASAPFEDEFALAKLALPSPYAALAVPHLGPPPLSLLDVAQLPEAERRRWDEGMLWFLRRMQLARPGRRLALKSPTHTARIGAILRLFPDARFVHVSRDPEAVFPSTIRLWRILHSRLGLRNPAGDEAWLAEHVLATLPAMYAAYERDLPLIPPGRLVEIRYGDLARQPAATVGGIYDALSLGDFATLRPALDAYLAALGPHRTAPPVSHADDGGQVRRRWSAYARRFGYD